jgi:hypothetical protein
MPDCCGCVVAENVPLLGAIEKKIFHALERLEVLSQFQPGSFHLDKLRPQRFIGSRKRPSFALKSALSRPLDMFTELPKHWITSGAGL